MLPVSIFSQYNISKIMEAGKNALEYKDYNSAIKFFNNVIDYRPKTHEAYYYRGKAKYYLGDYSGSETDFSEVLFLNPYYYDAYELRGLSRIQQQKYAEAAVDYGKASLYKLDEINISYNCIYCNLKSGNYIMADSLCDQFIIHWPCNTYGYILKAQVQYHLDNLDLFDKLLEHALYLDPYNLDCLSLKAHYMFSCGKWESADDYFTRFLHIYPNNADKLVYRGLCKIGEGNWSYGLKDFTTALNIFPEHILGLYNRALLYYFSGDILLSKKDIQKLLSTYSYEETAKHIMNNLVSNESAPCSFHSLSLNDFRILSDYSLSNIMKYVVYDQEDVFSTSISYDALKKDSIDTQNMYALLPPHNLTDYQIEAYGKLIHFRQGYESLLMKEYDSAITSFTLSIDEHPDICENYYNRAYAYANTNRYENSISDLNQTIKLNKNYSDAYYNRGLVYMRLNKIEEARKDFSKAGELGIKFAYRIINELSF